MNSGSRWNKWDLHVHTPDSIYHNYPKDNDEAWKLFINDLEALPPEFKVIGVNDYLFVDGYAKLLKAKQEGRIPNIALLLPVIELRLDKFAGTDGDLERVNLHVIFDEIDPDIIRTHFLSALTRHLTIDPKYFDSAKQWHAMPTRESLIELGELIISSVPDEEKKHFGAPLKEGFNNLNVSFDKVIEVLKSHYLSKYHLLALGKTEWSSIKWNDRSIADKKNLINNADCIFVAASTPEAYNIAKNSLVQQGVNNRLLDCSDAHWLSTSTDKDRIGNCFTWIKSEPSFLGLRHALLEFDKRVFVGDLPDKLEHVNHHPSRYIDKLSIRPSDTTSCIGWFNTELELNPGLVAVIGNKGSGKSALLDTMGLLGDSSNEKYFSFLNKDKFRHPRQNLANKFLGTLIWKTGEKNEKNLDEPVNESAIERVRYLPQQYIEKLCNELKGSAPGEFDSELRNIVFSHVDESDRLGYSNIDDLLKFLTDSHEKNLEHLRNEISAINQEIIKVEKAIAPKNIKQLELEKKRLEAEISAHNALKPEPVDKPADEDEVIAGLSSALENATSELVAIQNEIETLKTEKINLNRKAAVAVRIKSRLAQTNKYIDDLKKEIESDLEELNIGVTFDNILSLSINVIIIDENRSQYLEKIETIDKKLNNDSPDGLITSQTKKSEEINELKAKLAEPQRRYIAYQEALKKWEGEHSKMIGDKDTLGTYEYIAGLLSNLDKLPKKLEELKNTRRKFVSLIHKEYSEIVQIFKNLYSPITEFLSEFNSGDNAIPISFDAEITESGFSEKLWELINRQSRGSFYGIEESNARLKSLLQTTDLNIEQDVIRFVDEIDRQIHADTRDGAISIDITPESQLRKGRTLGELYNTIYDLSYLKTSYLLKFGDKSLEQLSPGERGLLLLIFYLLVDKSNTPLIVDQPEENLDNQTIYETLVRAVTTAVKRRQVIVATHSANVAVVCDADQIIQASRNPTNDIVTYESGSLEQPPINALVVKILEGTRPAFINRRDKYHE